MRPICAVLGGGVSGLTCAVRLLEQGWEVHVIAETIAGSASQPTALVSSILSDGLVSCGAGGLWEYPPYQVEPAARAKRWCLTTLAWLQALAAEPEETGVTVRRAHALCRRPPPSGSWDEGEEGLRDALPRYAEWAGAPARPAIAAAHMSCGYSFDAPCAFMPRYLAWLRRACTEMGARFHAGVRLSSLVLQQRGDAGDAASPSLLEQLQRQVPELFGSTAGPPALLVNCLGLANRELSRDAAAEPVRGVLAFMHCPLVQDVAWDHDAPLPAGISTYVIPQAHGVVACGGTAQRGEWNERPSREEVAAIVARCTEMVPALRGAVVLGEWVGLRPSRRAEAGGVRLEPAATLPPPAPAADAKRGETGDDDDDDARMPMPMPTAMSAAVVHNYGHGGSGVLCSWGCAQDVASLAAGVAAERGLVYRLAPLPLPRLLRPLGNRRGGGGARDGGGGGDGGSARL
jgi:D-amino-acid oxidase